MGDMQKKPVEIVQNEAAPVAFDLSKVKDRTLLAEVNAIKERLAEDDLAGIRARVIVLLDFSGSMSRDYENGNVQELIRRVLAFSMNVDTDGTIEVYRFGSDVYPVHKVDNGNYNRAARDLSKGRMGSTNLTAALAQVRRLAEESDEVIYLFVLTDGDPNDAHTAAQEYAQLANHAVFVKNIAIRPVGFLEQVDNFNAATAPWYLQPLAARPVDNCNTQFITNPGAETAETFAARATEEWATWFIAAQHAGILV